MVMFVICVQLYFIKRISAKMCLSSSQQTLAGHDYKCPLQVIQVYSHVCLPAFGGLLIVNAVCLSKSTEMFLSHFR